MRGKKLSATHLDITCAWTHYSCEQNITDLRCKCSHIVSTQCLSLHILYRGLDEICCPSHPLAGCQMTVNMNETPTLNLARFCPCFSFLFCSLSRLAPSPIYFHCTATQSTYGHTTCQNVRTAMTHNGWTHTKTCWQTRHSSQHSHFACFPYMISSNTWKNDFQGGKLTYTMVIYGDTVILLDCLTNIITFIMGTPVALKNKEMINWCKLPYIVMWWKETTDLFIIRSGCPWQKGQQRRAALCWYV